MNRKPCVYTEPRSGPLGSTERENVETRIKTLKMEAEYSSNKSVSVCRHYVETKLKRQRPEIFLSRKHEQFISTF
jgi:hypothetical protein